MTTTTITPAKPYNGNAPVAAVIAAVKKSPGLRYVSTSDNWHASGLAVRKTAVGTAVAKALGLPAFAWAVKAELAALSLRCRKDAAEIQAKADQFVAALEAAGYVVGRLNTTQWVVAGPGFVEWYADALRHEEEAVVARAAAKEDLVRRNDELTALLAEHNVNAWVNDGKVTLTLTQVRALIGGTS
jgi:hypothetical protein